MTTPAEHWQRLHPLSPILGSLRSLRRLGNVAELALPAIVVGRRLGIGGVGIGAVLLVLMVASRAANWWYTSYRLDAAQIVVRTGILNRTIREIPAGRVQQVEVTQGVVQRALKVTTLRIELVGAGAGENDVELAVVTDAEARRIRTQLDAARLTGASAASVVTLPPPERVLLRLGTRDLVLAAVTSAGLLAVPATILFIWTQIDEFDVDVPSRPSIGALGAALVGVVLLLVIPAVAAARMLLMHHGWTLSETRGEIRIARGLTSRRTSLVPLDRIQLLTIKANPLRRALGLSSIDVQTAATVAAAPGAGSVDDSLPVVRSSDRARIVGELMPRVRRWPIVEPVPRSALWARLFDAMALVSPALLVVAGLCAFVSWWFVPVALLVVLLAGSAAAAGFVTSRHGSSDEMIDVRRGWFASTRRLIVVDRIQGVRLVQGPVQRRLGLATVDVLLSRSRQRIRHVSVDQADELAARCRGVGLRAWRR